MDFYFLQLLIGFIGLTAIAIPFSSNIKEINYKNIIIGILFQIVLAFILIKIPIIVTFFKSLGDGVIALQNATQKGTSFLFCFWYFAIYFSDVCLNGMVMAYQSLKIYR